ncbi:glycosyltransferase family 4 protein [Pseudomonas sp. R1-7]|jgi:glycosyltransferase involved in cell wall biosynthesis|uniref:glycosyltransferase family 4 protein n=1 Tax=Pseudomonas sp. R1-7 TaxID=2817398 RepID=UPI003DA8F2BA
MSRTGVVKKDVCLVGHPYAPIGMGEHIRASFRSLKRIHQTPGVIDIYQIETPAAVELEEFSCVVAGRLAAINIFHINGNEIEQALQHLSNVHKMGGYNVIYPLWELPIYPKVWADLLDKFDEVWAPSNFIMDGLVKACKKDVYHMPLACEISLDHFLGRRYFGIPESDYTFLFFYDLRSYSTRKNPEGVVAAFRRLLEARPYSKAHLVVKVNGVESNPAAFEELREQVQDLHQQVTLIHQGMTSNEVKNLARCCDCFVSLHRSEGYGFGIAEAMVLGKPVIATSYSGNLDFMSEEVSLPVRYELIPVLDGEYPHHEGQFWADPDNQQAAEYMIQLVDDPGFGREVGRKASIHMQTNFSFRQTGLRYSNRLDRIREIIS